jgi:hypothetical protein
LPVDLIKLKDANIRRWRAETLTRGPEFLPVARRLVASKDRYQAVAATKSALLGDGAMST